MSKLVDVRPHRRRLKGLDEFETPEFVGRMTRVRRARAFSWWTMLFGTVVVGATLGLALF